MVRESLIKKVTTGKRLEGHKGASHVTIWGKIILGKCKDPQVKTYLACLKSSKEAVIAQAEWTNRHIHFIQKQQNTFFSSAHGTFSRIDHILGQKRSLNTFKIEITSSIFSNHNGMRLEINYKKKMEKSQTHGG